MKGGNAIFIYQDLEKASTTDAEKAKFVLDAINAHKNSADYKAALDAEMYATGKNATISKYQKLLYTLTGQAVPDNYTANHKCKSGFLKLFVKQETSFEVGNGVKFEKADTKKRLGKNIDKVLYEAVRDALIQKVSFGFFNLDHVEIYKFTEFAPLYDEKNGSLMAGIRFWQIDSERPLRATLFEVDGYTEYIQPQGKPVQTMEEKRSYKRTVSYSEADGEQIFDGGNYPAFPVVPLWANMEHQSELVGLREQIDCYDLIKSGFANDLDDASMIYWTITNAGGMADDETLAKFVEHMKIVRAAVVGDDDGGTKVESHTMDVPYQSREVYLDRLRQDLYRDAMALDVDKIAAGAINIPQLKAAYEPLNEKADELEMCLFDFFDRLLFVAGIDDTPSFERSMISNQGEAVDMVLAASEYLDDEYMTRKLLAILGDSDQAEEVLRRRDAEEAGRYKKMEQELEGLKQEEGEPE